MTSNTAKAGEPLDTEHAARAFVDRVSAKFAVAGAIVFGSRARHSHHPDSDADISILLRGPRGPFLVTKLALADIAFDVLLETGVLSSHCRFGRMTGSILNDIRIPSC